MALITNPQAIAFENTMGRAYAERMYGAYIAAKELVSIWNAQSLSAVIPNTSTDVFSDGAQTDGRPIVTGANMTNIITRAQELITDYEATSNAKLNTFLALAVTPR
jgi:hypothetical protein